MICRNLSLKKKPALIKISLLDLLNYEINDPDYLHDRTKYIFVGYSNEETRLIRLYQYFNVLQILKHSNVSRYWLTPEDKILMPNEVLPMGLYYFCCTDVFPKEIICEILYHYFETYFKLFSVQDLNDLVKLTFDIFSFYLGCQEERKNRAFTVAQEVSYVENTSDETPCIPNLSSNPNSIFSNQKNNPDVQNQSLSAAKREREDQKKSDDENPRKIPKTNP
jgi:hypothetical protein